MSQPERKWREWWIDSATTKTVDIGKFKEVFPEEYPAYARKPYGEDYIVRVIERAAYDEIQAKLAAAEAEMQSMQTRQREIECEFNQENAQLRERVSELEEGSRTWYCEKCNNPEAPLLLSLKATQRMEQLEAKLQLAVEALVEIKKVGFGKAYDVARETLEKIK